MLKQKLKEHIEEAKSKKEQMSGFKSFLNVFDLRKLEKQVIEGEISYARMVELINQKASETYFPAILKRIDDEIAFHESEVNDLKRFPNAEINISFVSGRIIGLRYVKNLIEEPDTPY